MYWSTTRIYRTVHGELCCTDRGGAQLWCNVHLSLSLSLFYFSLTPTDWHPMMFMSILFKKKNQIGKNILIEFYPSYINAMNHRSNRIIPTQSLRDFKFRYISRKREAYWIMINAITGFFRGILSYLCQIYLYLLCGRACCFAGALEINNLTCTREHTHSPQGIYDDTVQLREKWKIRMIYFIRGGAMASGCIPLTSGDRISTT